MLSGHVPFQHYGDNLEGVSAVKIIERIKKGDVVFPDSRWRQVSETAKDLIRGESCCCGGSVN